MSLEKRQEEKVVCVFQTDVSRMLAQTQEGVGHGRAALGGSERRSESYSVGMVATFGLPMGCGCYGGI